jgi:hypothetical protein
MAGQPRQAFVDPRVDYRHSQLMTEVAQHLDDRRLPGQTTRRLLTRSRWVARVLVGAPHQLRH